MTDVRRLVTLRNGCQARLNRAAWCRTEFRYLGVILDAGEAAFGWAWHADGRSIDKYDRAFDIVDSLEEPKRYFWLGADAENADD